MAITIPPAWLERPGEAAWGQIGVALLDGEPEGRARDELRRALEHWPESVRRVRSDDSDPWWRLGRESGPADLVGLARVLEIDTEQWRQLPTNSRWRRGGASGVRELDLRRIDEIGEVSPLVDALPNLSRLILDEARLVWHELGVRELAPILAGLHSPLETLGLRGVRLGKLGVELLIGSPALAELTRLNLASTELADPGARALAEWPHAHLRALSVRACKISKGALAWTGRSWLAAIEEIDLSLNSLTARTLAAILDGAPELARLVMTDSQIEPDVLGRATHRRLRDLDISRAVLGDWLFEMLLSSLGPALTSLTARDCDITDASLVPLSTLLPRSRLERLDLRDNSFSATGKAALAEMVSARTTIAV